MIAKVTHPTVFVTLSKMKNEFTFSHTTKKVNGYWHVCVKIKILLSGWRGWYWSLAVIPPIIVNERLMRLTAFHDQTWCSSCFCNNNTFNEILMALLEQKLWKNIIFEHLLISNAIVNFHNHTSTFCLIHICTMI